MKGIIPADIVDSLGTFWNYCPEGQVQIGNRASPSAAHIRTRIMSKRPDALASIDIVTYDAMGLYLNIECFDCKLVILVRLSDQARQPAQCWCQVGNKDAALKLTTIHTATFDGGPQSYIQFGDTRFRVLVPGEGIPWVMHVGIE